MLKRKIKINSIMTIISIIFGAIFFVSSVSAEISLSGNVYANGKYIWRGQNLGNAEATSYDLTLGFAGVNLVLFGNMDSIRDHKTTELDVTLNYGTNFGIMGISGGYTYYTFPGLEPDSSQEIYLTLVADVLLQPSISVYGDFASGNGTYILFSAGHSFDIKSATVNVGASVGYNVNQWTGSTGFSDLPISVTTIVPLGEKISLSQKVVASFSLDQTNYSNEFYGGISIAYKFF